MSFVTPLALALGLVLVPALILLYLLKVRRRDYEVSSTYLWTHLLRDIAAHEPWQKLRWNVLLAVQLVVLSLLILALARPFFRLQASESIHAILMIDASASMQMTDVPPSRFEAARQQAHRIVHELPEGSAITIMLLERSPQVLVTATPDRQQADRAIDGATVSGGSADLRQALLLAAALNSDRQRSRVYLLSDGALPGAGDAIDAQGLPVTFVPIGSSAANHAITVLSARPDQQNANHYQVFARVRNYADQPLADIITLEADGNPIESRELSLGPGEARDLIFEDLPVGARTVSARLGQTDPLPLDNQAYAVLDAPRTAQVLLVTNGNLFLEKALSLMPNLELFRAQPRRYFTLDADRYDVVIFDGFLPDVLPRGNLLLINPPDSQLFPVEGEVRLPRIRDWDREHPLLQFVDLRDVAIARATRLTPAPWSRVLVQGDDLPLLLAGEREERQRVVVLPFDLRQTNLPLSAAFPILMLNVMGYLEPPGQVDTRILRPGEPVTIAPAPQAEELQIRKPDGTTNAFKPAGAPIRFDQTALPGIYTVTQRAASAVVSQELFAVNPSDEAESDVRPRQLTFVNTGPDSAAGLDTVAVQRELWLWLIPPALLVLLFEWWWFHRRT